MAQRLITAGLVLLLGGLLLGGAGATVRAQDATPTTDVGLPVTPDPSECTVAEVSDEEILERMTGVVATPGAALVESMIEGTPEVFTLPAGEPAAEATVAEITALMREVVACINTGDFLRIFAFTSDAFLAQLLADVGEGDEDEDQNAAGTPESEPMPPELYVTLVAIHDVTLLPDGRVGALVETIFPDEDPGVQVDYFIFVEEDGHWLIDQIVEDLEDQFPPEGMATPAA